MRLPFHISKTYKRLWSLDAGIAMVVTDLHGDWDAYARYRDRFVTLHTAGQADCLIFTGDLIHREPSDGPDRSLEIVLDVLALRSRYGEAIMYLCGNHELPHLYGFVLSKGATEYTPGFEAALSQSGRRDEVLALFESLPLFIRTAAGVCITHAGASSALTDVIQAATLFDWSHQVLRDWADEHLADSDRAELHSGYARLSGADSYAAMVRQYLAVADRHDRHYDDLLRGFMVTAHPDFAILRDALFTRCEQDDSESAYAVRLAAGLDRLSGAGVAQYVLVAGHMATPGGHAVVAGRHLRLASGTHARPHSAAQYLLFDAARSVGGSWIFRQGFSILGD
jgi:hypothetical protein